MRQHRQDRLRRIDVQEHAEPDDKHGEETQVEPAGLRRGCCRLSRHTEIIGHKGHRESSASWHGFLTHVFVFAIAERHGLKTRATSEAAFVWRGHLAHATLKTLSVSSVVSVANPSFDRRRSSPKA